jgi:hypothetical protein
VREEQGGEELRQNFYPAKIDIPPKLEIPQREEEKEQHFSIYQVDDNDGR